MELSDFILALKNHVDTFKDELTSDDGTWSIKAVIDDEKNVYPLPLDTKLSSKVMEMQLHPHLETFAQQHGLRFVVPAAQNHYPDYSFIDDEDDTKIALDLKSTYLTGQNRVNGMTLGSYFGYMRGGTGNITFPYANYIGHVVLGIVYAFSDNPTNGDVRSLDDLDQVVSPIRDFQFFVQEKYKIAGTTPGSGNTRNIGSVARLDKLLNGQGPFADKGSEVFEEYWCNYLNAVDAREAGLAASPYRCLETFAAWKAGSDHLGSE